MNILKGQITKEHLSILLILLLALCIKISYLYHISNQPEFSNLIVDPQFNDYWAHRIIYGNNYPSPTGEDPMIESTPYGRPPGYPFLLACIYFIFGDNYYSPRLIQFFVGLINIYLTFLFVAKISNNKSAGLVSALLLTLLWEPVYFEGEINYPVWVISLVIIFIYLSLTYLQKNSIKVLLFLGLILGLFSLFRPNALIMFPFYLALIIFCNYSYNIKKMGIHLIVFSFSLLLIISPVFVRNYLVSREFFLISSFGGVNTYIGNNPYSTGDSPIIPDIINLCGVDNWSCFNYRLLVKGLGIKQEGREFSFGEASRFFYRKSLEFWKNNPLSAIKLTLRKTLLFWGPTIVSDGKVISLDRNLSFIKYLPGFPFLLGLTLFTISILLLKMPLHTEYLKLNIFLLIWCLLYSFSVIPFFISERYRVPIIPPLCFISGIGISTFLNNWKTEKYLKNISYLLLGVFCLFATYNIPIHYKPEQSRWLYHRAIVFHKSQKITDALNYAKMATKVNSTYAEPYSLLGIISLEQNKLDDAENYYKRALSVNPYYAMANNNLGYVMELKNQIEQAKQYYEKACNLSPVYSLAWINLGRVHLYYLNQLDEAEQCFSKAIELEPKNWAGWFHLGNVSIQKNNYPLAEDSYNKSLSLNPQNPHILNNLGFLCIQTQKYNKAIDYLRKALEINPQFEDAMFNLGNTFKYLGKLDEAIHWYQKTIEVNPNYPEAKKELDKLTSNSDKEDVRKK
ncbi:MAG TPA: tetratricopeptide repeat protein [Candidatus Hydrogenedens sp.]|nr:tetratricopeptide repeat protein [Candidatus Hydrogenedens sp.]